MDQGKRAESDVARLCGSTFLKDCVLESPRFRTPGGHGRELADALIPFGDTLIAIQVKTRTVQSGKLSDAELSRILRRAEKGADQVKTLARAIDSGVLESGATLRGVTVPLGGRKYSRIVGIVIVDVFDDNGTSVVDELEFHCALARVRDIPVHIFSACDFRVIAKEQDTVPDLLNYLDTRDQLLARERRMPLLAELDLFAVFKTRYPVIEECLRGGMRMLLVEPGLWGSVRDKFAQAWADRDARITPSYLVDKTIEQLHLCIGYDPAAEYPDNVEPGHTLPSGGCTAAEYWEILQELTRLTRIERAQLGAKMLEKATAADTKDYAFALIYRPPDVGPIVYLCSNESRHSRASRLRTLVKAACAFLQTPKAVGIATQSRSSQWRSHDFCLLDNVSFQDPDRAKKSAEQIFGNKRGTSLDEWGNDYASEMEG